MVYGLGFFCPVRWFKVFTAQGDARKLGFMFYGFGCCFPKQGVGGVKLHRSRLEFGVTQLNRVLGPRKQPRLLGLGFKNQAGFSAIQSGFRTSSEQ